MRNLPSWSFKSCRGKKAKNCLLLIFGLIAVWYYLSHRVRHDWTYLAAAAAAAASTDAKAESPILWPPHVKSWLIGKDSDAGRDWRQEEKGTTEDEMVGWHHWLDGHEFEWTLGVGDGQGGLACCDSWGCKESDTTERLNWTELNMLLYFIRKLWAIGKCVDLSHLFQLDFVNFSHIYFNSNRLLKWKGKLMEESASVTVLFPPYSLYVLPV